MNQTFFKTISVLVLAGIMCLSFTVVFANSPVILEETTNSVALGQPLLVTLHENPTTGYQWVFEISRWDILEFRSFEVVGGGSAETGGQAPLGAGRDVQWEFRSIKPGFSQIQFDYVRSWETSQKPEDTRIFHVSVLDQPGIQIFIDLKEVTNHPSVGQLMSVILEENPTTGYQWFFEISDPDSLSLIESKVKIPPQEGLVGAPRTMQWDFHATKPGIVWVHFLYYRSWEGKEQAIDEKVYVIHIHE